MSLEKVTPFNRLVTKRSPGSYLDASPVAFRSFMIAAEGNGVKLSFQLKEMGLLD